MFFNYQLDLGYQQLMANLMPTYSIATNRIAVPDSAAGLNDSSYASLVAWTVKRLSSKLAKSDAMDPQYRECRSSNGKFTLKANAWKLMVDDRSIASLRMVHIKSQKTEIINTWVFPKRPDCMPVFAAELIAMGRSTKVAFVDIQVPSMNEVSALDVRALSAALACRYVSLPSDGCPPSWATDDSQGNYAYARNADESWFTMISESYTAYLDAYLSAFAESAATLNDERAVEDQAISGALAQYQMHHMEHSPGQKFLSTIFGPEWTRSFLTQFLFTKP